MGCAKSTTKSVGTPSRSATDTPNAGFVTKNSGRKITDYYDIDKKKLGEGSYGSVQKAKGKSSGSVRAVKSIQTQTMKNTDRFKQEIEIMGQLQHPNIIRLYETYEDSKCIYLVIELASGGELFDRIIEAGHFTEVQAATLMQQIVKAIHYMHNEVQVCHRDLKPENFLFMTKDPIDHENNLLKIIDFGLSCKFKAGQILSTKAGTPYYVAPQVLAGKYDQSSDLWSIGVIMFVMLCGYPPFFGETDCDVLAKVRLGNFTFAAADWKNISEDAKTLIRNLLKMNPRDRFTAQQALNHTWISAKAPQAKGVNLQQSVIDNLRSFKTQNRLKKAALTVIAGLLSDKQIKQLRENFSSMDVNGDGVLNKTEILDGFNKVKGLDLPQDLEAIITGMDSDGSGNIDYLEFMAACINGVRYLQEDVCKEAFARFDTNGDKRLSPDELKKVLTGDKMKVQIPADELERILKEVDKNGDGEIDEEEFLQMMRGEGNA